MSKSFQDILIIFPGSLEFLTNRGGGREYMLSKLALKLSKDFTISIVAPFFGKYYKTIKIGKITVRNIYYPAFKKYPPNSQFVKLMQLFSIMSFYTIGVVFEILRIKQERLKLVFISDPAIGAIPGLVAKILKLKILCYEGNVTPWAAPVSPRISIHQRILDLFFLMLGKLTARMSDAIVVNDGLIKKGMVKQGIQENKIFVIRSLIDTQKFRPLRVETVGDEKFVVGYIGRLAEEKGAPLLLQLIKKSLKQLPEVSFIILGDGPLKERFQVLANVEHVGWIQHSRIPKKLNLVKVIVTFQRSFGVGELEALSCGKPIVASKIGEMTELIGKTKIGLLCEPNINAYIESIRILLKNEELLRKLSRKSRVYVLRNCSLESVCNQWKTVINYILQGMSWWLKKE
ncbi:MAG: glycosyltransferase family 4 protein [Candidatus Bathyarchaeia archaeon]